MNLQIVFNLHHNRRISDGRINLVSIYSFVFCVFFHSVARVSIPLLISGFTVLASNSSEGGCALVLHISLSIIILVTGQN
jgi:hypothetical protein